jgi:putative redox protein
VADNSIRIRWTGDYQFVGTGSNKRSVVLSSKDEQNNTGISPSELLPIGLAACSAYDVVNILTKQRQLLTELEVVVDPKQEPDPPWTYTHFHLIYQLAGPNLKESSAKRAVDLSLEKYCSVASTISGKAEISYELQINETRIGDQAEE